MKNHVGSVANVSLVPRNEARPTYQQVVILVAYYTASLTVIKHYSNILPVPKDEVEHKASHCKGNACSSQDGEDDSEGRMY